MFEVIVFDHNAPNSSPSWVEFQKRLNEKHTFLSRRFALQQSGEGHKDQDDREADRGGSRSH